MANSPGNAAENLAENAAVYRTVSEENEADIEERGSNLSKTVEEFSTREGSFGGKSLSTGIEPIKQGFGGLSPQDVKKLNRSITRQIPLAEKQKVMKERNELVQKKFRGSGLTEKEETRLTYLRWQLDRFDDADSGEFLDYLEVVTEGHEKFAKELKGFMGQIENVRMSSPKGKRPERRR